MLNSQSRSWDQVILIESKLKTNNDCQSPTIPVWKAKIKKKSIKKAQKIKHLQTQVRPLNLVSWIMWTR
jgi:hypothetical protein